MLCNHFTYDQSTVRPYALYTSVWILYHVIIGLLGVFAQRRTSRCVSESQHVHIVFQVQESQSSHEKEEDVRVTKLQKALMVFSPNLPT